ncbi:MAG: pseudaminic acid cytidylyltransferase [Pseudomonadota bacterium]
MNVAVIPARGGSKRIPRKSIKSFHGKPIMAWSIEAAQASGLFDRVMVSTDDDEIADIAVALGAEVPFKRPAELADDYATTLQVMSHAAAFLEQQYTNLEAVCCIYPAAPFIRAEEIQAGHQALFSSSWQYAFSVTNYATSVYRSFIAGDSGGVEMIFPDHYETRSQDLPECLHDAAQFYWGRPSAWIQQLPIFAAHSVPIRIPNWRVVDIDTPEDWERALARAATISSQP